ncbi:hypothetical protein DUNSADRAFT_13435 [Dunaliella salina]|uniref:Secreted protein n=1 Tax=Dunaliella salina TaxID=3046 RepID=A0ABQ7G9D0_DUNSA|nr:hypothetical protein DUNSADRAFT_13435 [Dunaliella salina]KAF5831227.1 hypothetical protein DUNSADRAFT_13435 [Dunaliella salina]|eukprot:KAF5831226.1 hypothetical protein DUNSADRAFT_13435 [Dunaliella salina]
MPRRILSNFPAAICFLALFFSFKCGFKPPLCGSCGLSPTMPLESGTYCNEELFATWKLSTASAIIHAMATTCCSMFQTESVQTCPHSFPLTLCLRDGTFFCEWDVCWGNRLALGSCCVPCHLL